MNFGKLFGKKGGGKPAPKQDNNQATQLMLDQKIKEQELRITNLETKANALQQEAKAKLKAGDKGGAKRILAKKKKIVEQIKQVEGAMAMMEEQKMMLDNTLAMKDVMSAIKQGNQAVKEAAKGMSVEDLEDMKDQMDEVKADQEELNNFFKDYATENNEDVEEELEGLEEELAKEESGALPMANQEQLNPTETNKVTNAEEDDLNKFLAV
jgi:hypothetical protein